MAEQTIVKRKLGGTKGERYLTFTLDHQLYGVDALQVREIIGVQEITNVPHTPKYVRGVINLRGQVIPVVDLRDRFGLSPADSSINTCIVVLYVGDVELGIVVDNACEVVQIHDDDFEETPSFGANINTDFISGIGKLGGQITILLDVDKLLTNDDSQSLDNICKANTTY